MHTVGFQPYDILEKAKLWTPTFSTWGWGGANEMDSAKKILRVVKILLWCNDGYSRYTFA